MVREPIFNLDKSFDFVRNLKLGTLFLVTKNQEHEYQFIPKFVGEGRSAFTDLASFMSISTERPWQVAEVYSKTITSVDRNQPNLFQARIVVDTIGIKIGGAIITVDAFQPEIPYPIANFREIIKKETKYVYLEDLADNAEPSANV